MSESLSLYQFSVPVLVHSLKALSAIVDKAQAYAGDSNVDETVLTSARLFPNMFPFSRQIQIACDVSKACGARLAGVENPSMVDTETTFDELKGRIAKTVAFLEGLDKEAIDGAGDKEISFKAGPHELTFSGQAYVREWVYPNFYFHVTTAYNLLRHNGLSIGKPDFLGM
jgi:hypothetical protein